MKDNSPVLTFDGPSDAGKGTISKCLAEKLAWHYLDSGAIYRALGVAVTTANVDLNKEQAVCDLAKNIDIEFKQDNVKEWVVILNNVEIQDKLQSEEIGDVASKIAVYPAVRKALLDKQRDFNVSPGLVADGRDMGSTVFPNAKYKVFLTADAQTRGKRRYKQLIEKGINANLRTVIEDIEQRDERDKTRSASPLIIPDDALVIDSSNLEINDVVNRIVNYINN